MSNFDQFLDQLSDEELQLMDSDPEFFQEMKSQWAPQPGMLERIGQQVGEASKTLQGSPMDLLGNVAPELAQRGADIIGEKGAEALAERGVDPRLAAGAGTVAQMAPSILMSLTPGAVQTGAKGVGAIGKALSKSPKSSMSKVLKTDLANLPTAQAREATKLKDMRKMYGELLGEARVKSGIPQGRLSDLPIEKDVTSFADEMAIIAQRSPDDLARTYGKEGLAQLKDTVQHMRELKMIPKGTRLSADVSKGVDRVEDALAIAAPEMGGPLAGYRAVGKQLDELPAFYKSRAADLRTKIAKLPPEKQSAGRSVLKRLFSKALPYGAATILGSKIF